MTSEDIVVFSVLGNVTSYIDVRYSFDSSVEESNFLATALTRKFGARAAVLIVPTSLRELGGNAGKISHKILMSIKEGKFKEVLSNYIDVARDAQYVGIEIPFDVETGLDGSRAYSHMYAGLRRVIDQYKPNTIIVDITHGFNVLTIGLLTASYLLSELLGLNMRVFYGAILGRPEKGQRVPVREFPFLPSSIRLSEASIRLKEIDERSLTKELRRLRELHEKWRDAYGEDWGVALNPADRLAGIIKQLRLGFTLSGLKSIKEIPEFEADLSWTGSPLFVISDIISTISRDIKARISDDIKESLVRIADWYAENQHYAGLVSLCREVAVLCKIREMGHRGIIKVGSDIWERAKRELTRTKEKAKSEGESALSPAEKLFWTVNEFRNAAMHAGFIKGAIIDINAGKLSIPRVGFPDVEKLLDRLRETLNSC